MAAQKQQEKEPVNIIHQNAIFRETIMKEQRHQKLYTSFGFNPYKKCKYKEDVWNINILNRIGYLK